MNLLQSLRSASLSRARPRPTEPTYSVPRSIPVHLLRVSQLSPITSFVSIRERVFSRQYSLAAQVTWIES